MLYICYKKNDKIMKRELLEAVLNNDIFFNTNPKFESFKKGVTKKQLPSCDIECYISNKSMVLKVSLIVRGKSFSCTASIPCGLITKSGYVSTKKMPVDFDYSNERYLTDAEVLELSQFFSDAKATNYDPFYAQTRANRESAMKLIAICNNITDPYDVG